jgi:hypothetical protein
VRFARLIKLSKLANLRKLGAPRPSPAPAFFYRGSAVERKHRHVRRGRNIQIPGEYWHFPNGNGGAKL